VAGKYASAAEVRAYTPVRSVGSGSGMKLALFATLVRYMLESTAGKRSFNMTSIRVVLT